MENIIIEFKEPYFKALFDYEEYFKLEYNIPKSGFHPNTKVVDEKVR